MNLDKGHQRGYNSCECNQNDMIDGPRQSYGRKEFNPNKLGFGIVIVANNCFYIIAFTEFNFLLL